MEREGQKRINLWSEDRLRRLNLKGKLGSKDKIYEARYVHVVMIKYLERGGSEGI